MEWVGSCVCEVRLRKITWRMIAATTLRRVLVRVTEEHEVQVPKAAHEKEQQDYLLASGDLKSQNDHGWQDD